MSRPRLLALGGLLAASAALGQPAGAGEDVSAPTPCAGSKVTCDEGNQLCCNWWIVDVLVDGEPVGQVFEESYQKLQRSLERGRTTDKLLCRFWGDHDDCAKQYGEPRCDGVEARALHPALGKAVKQAAPSLDRLLGLAENSGGLVERVAGDLKLFAKIDKYRPAALKALHDPAGGAVDAELSLVREKFAGAHHATADYLEGLKEVVGRARSLREGLEQCADSNPFRGVESGECCGYGFGARLRLPSLWNNGGRFGGHDERERQAGRNRDAGGGLQYPIDQARRLRPFERLRVEDGTKVVGRSGGKKAHLLLGAAGTVEVGEQVPAGEHPLAAVALADSDLRLGAVEIARESAGEGGERTVLTARVAGETERVTLLRCAGGAIARGTSCACPAREHWEGAECVECPPGTRWDGKACACPAGLALIRGACGRCPAGARWEAEDCVCAGSRQFDGERCLAPAPPAQPQPPPQQQSGTCPPGTVWIESYCRTFLHAYGYCIGDGCECRAQYSGIGELVVRTCKGRPACGCAQFGPLICSFTTDCERGAFTPLTPQQQQEAQRQEQEAQRQQQQAQEQAQQRAQRQVACNLRCQNAFDNCTAERSQRYNDCLDGCQGEDGCWSRCSNPYMYDNQCARQLDNCKWGCSNGP